MYLNVIFYGIFVEHFDFIRKYNWKQVRNTILWLYFIYCIQYYITYNAIPTEKNKKNRFFNVIIIQPRSSPYELLKHI